MKAKRLHRRCRFCMFSGRMIVFADLFVVDEYKPDQADKGSQQFVPCQWFVVKSISDKKERNGKKAALYEKCCADLPTGFISKNPTCFQPHNDYTECGWGPVKFFIFFYQVFTGMKKEIKNNTCCSCNQICYR